MNIVDGDFAVGAFDKLVNHLAGQVDGDVAVVEGGLRHERNEGSFQFADVGVDVVGNVFNDLVGHFHTVVVEFLAQDVHAGLHIGRKQLGSQSPFEARGEACLEALQLAGSLVAGDDELFVGLV